jgi:murein DD-endopeptidase MepM/ murein hydrolase activator NlpD
MTEETDSPASLRGGLDEVATNQWRRIAALAQKGLAPLLSRYTTHLVVVLLVTVALSMAGMEVPGSTDYLNTPTPAPHPGEREVEPVTARGGGRSDYLTSGPLLHAPVLRTTLTESPTPVAASGRGGPFTVLSPSTEEGLLTLQASLAPANPEEAMRREIITYTVRSGDTVSGIAAHFGLDPNTIVWSNAALEPAPDLLKLGQVLTILPLDGAYHTVVAGDTLESIAGYYKVTVEDIVNCELNQLPDDSVLPVGLKLVVPGGEKPYIPRVVHHYTGPIPEDASRGTGVFGPPVSGWITQGFWQHHKAIDIGNVSGTPIYASDSGYVARVGWSDIGYGKMILIDHGNGFQTLYAHLSVILVAQGDSVAKGTLIGRMGSTGNSTGSHLHFEIRENGVQRNPQIYVSW